MIGVLGGGQLGRMLALAGYPLGLRFRFLDPSPEAPAGQLAEQLQGSYDDEETLEQFASGLSLITYEFENVPVRAARFLAARAPVYPPPDALETAQDRVVEKTCFQTLAIPTPPFAAIDTRADLEDAVARIGLPAMLKTRRDGYDGKGQRALRTPDDVSPAWEALGGRPLILEGFVSFQRELSLLCVRGREGQTAFYPLIENAHQDGILRLSLAPAPNVSFSLQAEAETYGTRLLEAFDYVGVLAVELFESDGRLLANEMAPRVHNSGHWTIEGAETSQFSNHLRAILGLPIGSTRPLGHAAMLNLIGATPAPEAVLALPGAGLHLYGKTPRPGRKLGHVTLRADDPETLAAGLARLKAVI